MVKLEQLFEYIKEKDTDAVQELLKQPLDINQVDAKGRTALMIAAKEGKSGVVRLLLEYGADPDIVDQGGMTALDIARLRSPYIVKLIQNVSPVALKKLMATRDSKIKHEKVLLRKKRVKKVVELGHALGLSGTVDLAIEDSPIPQQTEGNNPYQAVAMLRSLTDEYITRKLESVNKTNTKPREKQMFLPLSKKEFTTTKQFKKISSALKSLKNFLSMTEPLETASQKLADRYNKEHKVTAISCSWTNHAVAIFLYKGYLVYCNRGIGRDPHGGARIFKLKKGATLKADWIAKLRPQTPAKDQKEIEALIAEMVNLSQPIISLPSKVQKHGTCAFVNMKSGVEGVLTIQGFLDASRSQDVSRSQESRRSEDVSKTSKNNEKIRFEEASVIAEVKYKRYIQDIRNIATHRLLSDIADAIHSGNKNEIRFFSNLAVKIISQHSGIRVTFSKTRQPEKATQELKRATEILMAFDEMSQKEILRAVELEGINLLSQAIKHKFIPLMDLIIPTITDQEILKRYIYNNALDLDKKEDLTLLLQKITDLTHTTHAATEVESFCLEMALQNKNDLLILALLEKCIKPEVKDLVQYLKNQLDSKQISLNTIGKMNKIEGIFYHLPPEIIQRVVALLREDHIDLVEFAVRNNKPQLLVTLIRASTLKELGIDTIDIKQEVPLKKNAKDILSDFLKKDETNLQKLLENALEKNKFWLVDIILELGAKFDPAKISTLINKLQEVEPKDSTAGNNAGDTALHRALSSNWYYIIDFLLKEAKVNPNAENSDGDSALSAAIEMRDIDAVRILAENSANFLEPDTNQKIALKEVIQSKDLELINTIFEIRSELVKEALKPSYASGIQSLIFVVTVAGMESYDQTYDLRVKLLDKLLKNGADIDERDSEGRTPLMLAASLGNKNAVKLLLENNARIDVKDKKGATLLDLAKKRGSSEFTEWLDTTLENQRSSRRFTI